MCKKISVRPEFATVSGTARSHFLPPGRADEVSPADDSRLPAGIPVSC